MGESKAGKRIIRWLYTLAFGSIPLLASAAVHNLVAGDSSFDVFQNPPELSIFALVVSATVIADIFETAPIIGWNGVQAVIILVMILCLAYAAFLYAFCVREIIGGPGLPDLHHGILLHSSRLAGSCGVTCTVIEVWIARKEALT